MALVAAFICSVLAGFTTKSSVFEQNCIVIEDICCLIECGGGTAAAHFFSNQGEVLVKVAVKKCDATEVILTVKNSETNSIVINEVISLTPQKALATSINMSALQENVPYEMTAQFLHTDKTDFTTPILPIFVH
jgi:hypothetical protein